ncbi:MAG TPA: BTAD domain-containing putative transcriptional regulator [Stackebrandtia sp.]|uniref:AfsR/SARP family transcriptional regulator n=1 Tax=Stackebrandtia sp. TaxID=2023065 RepID=UPI002D3662CC|nr:BTAD domain-containing putative transcriptional regulator [Stackebrandtia sp.]HZE40386.1 BTAD domain-containing putative transcriptional regulator [Stackebrandtia sp.]
MRFAVLGPLEVSQHDGELELRAAKQRLLLSVLLTQPGRPMPVDRIGAALWADRPPVSVDRAVSWHIHKLRRLLDDDNRIRQSADGYAIDVAVDEFDVHQFDARRRAAADAAPEAAAELLARALGLWRGTRPFGRLTDHPGLRAESLRLNETRLSTIESRVEADLAIGRHGDLIDELTGLVAEHSTRERFRAQLMLALYRSGRQADALRVHREGREAMIEELGLEPGAELNRLERAIADNDPILELTSTPPTATTVRGGHPAPAELPGTVRGFTGRRSESDLLGSALTGPGGNAARVCAISGGPGVGKSALAVHVGLGVAGAYPDGQLYAHLAGATPGATPTPAEEVLARFLRSLDTAAPPALALDELAARFRSVTATKRLLVVLDDARDIAQIRPLLPAGHGCGVIVTSRRTLATLDEATQVGLATFAPEESQRFLVETIGARRAETQAEDVAELADLCGHLPLALRLAAARLLVRPQWPVAAMVRRLSDEKRRLTELRADDRAVAASIAVSHLALREDPSTADAARLFDALGLHPGIDIDAHAAAALLDSTAFDVRTALETLCDVSLLEETTADRFRMHDLVRLHARENAQSTAVDALALKRLRHHYLACARNALRAHAPYLEGRLALPPRELCRDAIPWDSTAAAYEWFGDEIDNLVAVARQAVPVDQDPRFVDTLTSTIFPVGAGLGLHLRKLLALAELGLEAATVAENTDRQIAALLAVGETHGMLWQFDKAIGPLESGLAKAGASTNRRREITALVLIAKVLRLSGDAPAALDRLDQARELNRRDGTDVLEDLIRGQRSIAYAKLGRYDEAIEEYEDRLRAVRDRNDDHSEMMIRINIGYYHRRAGRPERALAEFGRSAELSQLLGTTETTSHADILWGRGEALDDVGDHDAALRCWAESATLLERLDQITADERDAIIADPRPDMPQPLRPLSLDARPRHRPRRFPLSVSTAVRTADRLENSRRSNVVAPKPLADTVTTSSSNAIRIGRVHGTTVPSTRSPSPDT